MPACSAAASARVSGRIEYVLEAECDMPRIDFICAQCDHHFTEFVKYEERVSLRCPSCQAKEIRQDFSGVWNRAGGSGKAPVGASAGRSGFS